MLEPFSGTRILIAAILYIAWGFSAFTAKENSREKTAVFFIATLAVIIFYAIVAVPL